MSEIKPTGWFTDDYLADKSATTYDAEVAERWRQKGWAVTPIFTIPADQVLVPRELVGRCAEALIYMAVKIDAEWGCCMTEHELREDEDPDVLMADDLRTLLHP